MSDPPHANPVAPLDPRLPADASAPEIAAAVATIWNHIEAALRPVMGAAGVLALQRRSLYLASTRHAFLAGLHEAIDDTPDPTPLAARLAPQPAAAARAAGNDVLHTLHSLLASLVGASLTQRLLRDVADPTNNSAAAQDPS